MTIREVIAKANHDHWQGAPSGRDWAETCEKFPPLATDFRRKAVAIEVALIEAGFIIVPIERIDVDPAVAFSRWIMEGPKPAAAAGCYVGIKVTAAKGGDK